MNELQQELIDEVLDNFDFPRVLETMELLKWEWAPLRGVPELHDLKKTARSLLKTVVVHGGLTGTGGFVATNIDGVLELRFEISSWGVYVDENGLVVPT